MNTNLKERTVLSVSQEYPKEQLSKMREEGHKNQKEGEADRNRRNSEVTLPEVFCQSHKYTSRSASVSAATTDRRF